jgi:hypothetical protein
MDHRRSVWFFVFAAAAAVSSLTDVHHLSTDNHILKKKTRLVYTYRLHIPFTHTVYTHLHPSLDCHSRTTADARIIADSRISSDIEFKRAGAEISESLAPCGTIIGVKEVPPHMIVPDRTWCFFTHTIKGQEWSGCGCVVFVAWGCQLCQAAI